MLRGFRWQFIALLMSGLLFMASLTTRFDSSDAETVEPTPSPVAPAATLTPDATPNISIPLEPETPSGSVQTFIEGLTGTVQRLNPLLVHLNPADRDISSLIFEGLVRINAYGEPEPALAKQWVISSDGLEYIFQLRDDVLWQDGTPFSARDVAFTASLLRATDFPGSTDLGEFWRTVETEVLGEHLVRFRLTQPLGSFLDKLRIGILPFHALEGTTAAQLITHPFNLSPIGTGPYQLETLRFDGSHIQIVDLRVAPVYRLRPEGQDGYTIDRMRFRLYSNFDEALQALAVGEIDGLMAPNSRQRARLIRAGNNHQVHTALDPTLGIIIFNWQRETTQFFREQRIRLSLEIGVDRSSVIERWLLNRAVRADGPLFPGSWAFTSDLTWPSHDPVQARLLLETANIRRNDDDETESETESPYLFSFSILTPEDPAIVNMMNEIAVQWSQLGIEVLVDAVEANAYQTRLEQGDFDAALVELSLGHSADPDVYAFWHQGQYPDGTNYGGVDDRRISEVLELARRDPSGINRSIHYQQFQQDFVERAIALPLYYPLFTYVTSNRVAGVQIGFIGSPEERFLTLSDWTISGG
jgi:peptide/nickel transport system substrate-binding protein